MCTLHNDNYENINGNLSKVFLIKPKFFFRLPKYEKRLLEASRHVELVVLRISFRLKKKKPNETISHNLSHLIWFVFMYSLHWLQNNFLKKD